MAKKRVRIGGDKGSQRRAIARQKLASGEIVPDDPGTCERCTKKKAGYGVNGRDGDEVFNLALCTGCYMAICKSDFGAEITKILKKIKARRSKA
jgi:hypothetical protein